MCWATSCVDAVLLNVAEMELWLQNRFGAKSFIMGDPHESARPIKTVNLL